MTRPADARISWKRWWAPIDSDVADTAGFLDDPEGPYAEYFTHVTVALSDLDDAPCVILLGEAGIGKTSELRSETKRLVAAGKACLYVDLGDEPDVASLRHTLDNDPGFDKWKSGDGPLTLLLDSFDEATLTIDKLVSGLTRILQELPLERLNLRIGSRSSVWSKRLGDELEQRFGEVRRLTLCPLTPGNAEEAARVWGVDPAQFLSDIAVRDLGVLAARPLTLRMLLDLAAVGPLPSSRNQLFRESSALLARENNERRQEEHTTDLPVAQRLTLARRLAALTLLTNRPAVRLRPTSGTLVSDVVVEDLAADATELANFGEVLQSGLFASAVNGTVRFTHRSVAEFLAAEALVAMPLATVEHLLVDPLHPGRVVPQLAGTAVWAAALDDTVYRWLANLEPDLLLTANLVSATEEHRRIVGRAVLAVLDGPVPPRDRRYTWLTYDGLATDVAPYLADDRESWVKVEAAHMLSHTGCHDLDERLVELIEDIAERRPADYLGDDTRLATAFVYALHATERPDLLERLTAVANRHDAPIHMRAEILGELWGRLPTTTLLAAVDRLGAITATSPVASTVATELASAIERNAVEPDDLIDWFAKAGFAPTPAGTPVNGPHDEWQSVVTATAFAAAVAETPLSPAHASTLSRALYGWNASTHLFLPDRGFHRHTVGANCRRRLLTMLLPELPDRAAAYHLTSAALVTDEDLEWLLRLWGENAADTAFSGKAKTVVEMLVDPTDAEQQQLARTVADDFPFLTAALDDLYDPALAAQVAASRASGRDQTEKKAARTAAREFQAAVLDEAVEADDFHTVLRQLQKQVGTRQHALGAVPADAPAWKQLDTETRARVLDLALAHLRTTPSDLGSTRADDVGYAYALLHTERPGATVALDPDTVLAWLDTVRRLPAHDHTVEAMIGDLAATRPGELDRRVVEMIDEDANQPYPRQIRKLGAYTSAAVEDALYDLAVHRDMQGHVVEAALDALCAREPERGVRAARRVIARHPDTRPTGSLFRLAWYRAVHSAAALVNSPSAADDLDGLLALLGRTDGLASDVIAATGGGAFAGTSWPTLDADQLAILYLWARRTLPQAPEYAPHGVFPVNDVHDFPSHVFNRLAALDTPEAVAAVERIADELDAFWPRRTAADIARRVREKDWTPLTLHAVTEVLADPTRRAVTSEQQLARVLLDVIDEVAELIAADPDTASLFWHKQAGSPTTWRPVDEPTFTTRFVQLLRPRLEKIVIRQEGQLNLKIGEIKGSFPDIEAVTVHDGLHIAVVGEAKGNWNDEVLTAIDTQLTQRYVLGVRTSTGIYIVAYFASDKWDPNHRARDDARKHDLTELRETLEKTARTLSTAGKTIHVRVIPIEI